jgi:NAD(P)-dependent dehydrogenase (short-subunit alcohol dehydrogenase family)
MATNRVKPDTPPEVTTPPIPAHMIENRDIENKEIVLITGGNTGIGFETVKALFRSLKAYHVILGSRKAARGEDAVAQLQREFPDAKSSVDVVQVDISDMHEVPRVFETVRSKFGRVDALVNNAGTFCMNM